MLFVFVWLERRATWEYKQREQPKKNPHSLFLSSVPWGERKGGEGGRNDGAQDVVKGNLFLLRVQGGKRNKTKSFVSEGKRPLRKGKKPPNFTTAREGERRTVCTVHSLKSFDGEMYSSRKWKSETGVPTNVLLMEELAVWVLGAAAAFLPPPRLLFCYCSAFFFKGQRWLLLLLLLLSPPPPFS